MNIKIQNMLMNIRRSDFQIQYGKSSSLSESQKYKLKNDIIFLLNNMSFGNILI